MGYIDFIGLGKKNSEESNSDKFVPLDKLKVAERYLKYVEDLFTYHKERQQIIENKNSLLIGQVSIVISIVSLFIPLFNDEFEGFSNWLVLLIVLIFVFILFHYGLTLYFSITNLEIHKRKFATGATSTITKVDRATTEIDFINEQISDLVFCINQNNKEIKTLGDSLIYAGRNFKIANFTFLGFTTLLVVFLLLIQKSTPEVKVLNLSELKCSNFKDTSTLEENQSLGFTDSISIENKIERQSSKIDSINLKIDMILNRNISFVNRPSIRKIRKPDCPCPCP